MNKKQKTLIKNGFIVDGTGQKGFFGSLLLEGEHIIEVAENIEGDFDQVIDANCAVIAPGFIDTHSHSDVKLLENGTIEPKIMQGITTEILGQDGIATTPLPKKYISDWRKNLAGLDGDSDNINWNYKNTKGYLKQIEKIGLSQNESYLLPHGNVRMEAMGLDNREPSEKELKKMKSIVKREMKNGAIGFSTGLIYIPCAYAKTEEVIECCKVVAKLGGVFVVHQRSEADDILNSVDEILRIGRESGVRIHFSHMKACGIKNSCKIDEILKKFDNAEKEGIKISFDQYPYVAGSTMLGVILPPWAHDGGTNKLLERLKSPELRKKMVKDIETGIPGWDNFVDFAGLDQIWITSVKTQKNQIHVGKNLIQLGESQNKDPYEATFDLLLEEENAVGMVDFYGTEEDVIKFLKRPEQNVCTDGLLGGKQPHPRVYGSFPRVLGKYVREEGILTLEEAIYKMTSKPAKLFGFEKRGELKAGNFADIVIFNKDTIIDKGTYVEPKQFPEGINYVFVNGHIVVNDGKFTPKTYAGKVLRHKI